MGVKGTALGIVIRREAESDAAAVHRVVASAFEHADHACGDEQYLVDRLRSSVAFIPELSLVAEASGEIVGHILFTRMRIGEHASLALAPVSVLPDWQRKGIGSRLILEGHRVAQELGYGSVVVVGHASYYPRFGYAPASRWNITAPFEVPDECFLVVELARGSLDGIDGVIEYAKEFFPR